jgi:diguanylate cyclase (GGDEF)-like protein
MRAELDGAKKELTTLYAALGNIENGVLLLDKDLRSLYSNPALHSMFDIHLPRQKILDGKVFYPEILQSARSAYGVTPDKLDDYVARRLAWAKSGDPKPVDQHLANGCVIRCQCNVLPGGGRMLTYSDVTDIVRNAQELERLATIDGMTGIYNRRHFLALADHEWSRSRRYKRAISFLMIDIDFFKSINDKFGHEGGDQMIVHLTKLARDCKRDSDVLARIGGEEFAILLPETNLQQAQIIAERLRSEVAANPLIAGPVRISATISIGVAAAAQSMTGIADLMKAADKALYDAKNSGRNCVICCDGLADPTIRREDVPLAPLA